MPTTANTTSNERLAAGRLTHLQRLEAEAIHIMREAVSESEQPGDAVLDRQGQLGHAAPGDEGLLPVEAAVPVGARRHHVEVPGHVPVPRRHGGPAGSRTHGAPEPGVRGAGDQPVRPRLGGAHRHVEDRGSQAGASTSNKFDLCFGGARRDEEKSRAKERIFSVRSAQHQWDPKRQRPELWRIYNARRSNGETLRVFPISNWTELDVWQYIHLEQIPIVPLYFAAPRPVVDRDGTLIMVDDDRMPLRDGEVPEMRSVRFRTLGCYPLSGADRERRRHADGHHPGDAAGHDVGAAGADHRLRQRRFDGEEEAGGVLLMAACLLGPHRRRHRGVPALAPVQEPAAVHHVRQRRRRQEHAHRPAALRVAPRVRGPPRRARGRLGEGRHAGRRPRLRAAARRAHRRARAGHHDRRRLPLLLHRAPQVHRRRHPGPRAVHAQHGHRRVDRRRRGDPRRRPQGHAHPDPPAQLPRVAARHQAGRRGDQQDGPRRLLARRSSTAIAEDYLEFAARIGLDDVTFIPLSALQRRQHHRAERRTRPGTTARRCSAISRPCRSTTRSPTARSACPCSG